MPYLLPDPPIKTGPDGKIIGAKKVPEQTNIPAAEGDPEAAKSFLRGAGLDGFANMIDVAQAGGNPLSGNVVTVQSATAPVEPDQKSAIEGDLADGVANTPAAQAALANGTANLGLPSAKGENVLYQYASVNHIFTFACLSPDELNKPDATYRKAVNPLFTVLKGSGEFANQRPQTAAEAEYGIYTNYFMDNLEIETVIAPNPKSRQTNFFNFTFEIMEPLSMGQLLQTMQLTAKAAGYENYLQSPWLIQIEFKGYDQEGQPVTGGYLKKLLPIKLVNLELNTDVNGSVYRFTASAYNDVAFTDQVQSLQQDFTISGNTLKEAVQTGLNSLATHMNTKLLKQKQQSTDKSEVDEYIFVFPTDTSSNTLEQIINNPKEQGAATTGDLAFREFEEDQIEPIFETGSEGYVQDNSDYGASIKTQKKSFIDGRLGFSVKRGKLSESIKSVLANRNVPGNAIGESSFAPADGLDSGNIPFGLQQFAYNVETGLLERGKTVIDPKKRTITFKAGSKIQRILEELVLISDYGKNILQDAKKLPDGMVNWFRIESSVYVVNDPASEKVHGRMPRIYLYRVVPYKVHRSKFQMPNDPPPGFNKLVNEAAREYNYLYTGKNNDILSFDLNFDMAFYEGIQNDLGQNRGAGDPSTKGNNDEDVKVEETGETNTPSAASTSPRERENKPTGSPTSGAVPETAAIQVARQFNEAIVNSNVSLLNIEMEIMGDPYFITDSGVGNYNAEATNFYNINIDNTVNHQSGEVDILVNFRTPIDYGNDGAYLYDGKSIGLKDFSGLYQVITITNKFSDNVFTQAINAIRRKNYELKDEGETDKKAIEVAADNRNFDTLSVEEQEKIINDADTDKDGALTVAEIRAAGLTTDQIQKVRDGKTGKKIEPSDEEKTAANPSNTGFGPPTNTDATDPRGDQIAPPTTRTTPTRTGGAGTANIDRYYRYGNNNR